MRGSDIVGRLGGEEFAVIVAEPMEFAARIAERLRAGFEEAGVMVGGHATGATVSIGAATSYEPVTDISALIARADAALYRAKHDGRNRLYAANDRPAPRQNARLIAAARSAQAGEPVHLLPAKAHARRAKSARAVP
jgi:predicted signal transduction protein with EAL and GGDEF domain